MSGVRKKGGGPHIPVTASSRPKRKQPRDSSGSELHLSDLSTTVRAVEELPGVHIQLDNARETVLIQAAKLADNEDKVTLTELVELSRLNLDHLIATVRSLRRYAQLPISAPSNSNLTMSQIIIS